LRFLWSCERAPDVELIHPKASAHLDACHSHGANAFLVRNDVNTTALNNVLQALRRDDLQLKIFSTLLGRICIRRDGVRGFVHYIKAGFKPGASYSQGMYTRYHIGADTERAFETSTTNHLAFQSPIRPGLFSMSQYIQSRIIGRLLYPNVRIALDLDCKDPRAIWSSCGLALTQVNRVSLQELHGFWNQMFLLNLTSTDTRTSFSGYRALYWWLTSSPVLPPQTGRVYPYSINNRCRLDALRFCKINLQVKSDVAVSMSDIRISIIDLIRVTSHVDAGDSINIVVRVTLIEHLTNGAEKSSVQEEISLWDLRMAALKAMRYLSRKTSNMDSLCPEVFIDPSGRLVEYRLAGTVRFRALPKRISERMGPLGQEKPYDGTTVCYLRYLTMLDTGVTAGEAARSGES
jgi:hypothetical protein